MNMEIETQTREITGLTGKEVADLAITLGDGHLETEIRAGTSAPGVFYVVDHYPHLLRERTRRSRGF